jgi:hypothetical protein
MSGILLFLAVSAAAAIAAISLIMAHAASHPPRHTAAYALRRGMPIDPAALGFRMEEWHDHSHGWAPIQVWDIRFDHPAIDSRDRVAALAIHGWGESRIDLLAATQDWLPLFTRVLAFDRRGHGETAGSARLGDARERADIASIAARIDGSPFVLLTSGSGAALARSFTRKLGSTSVPLGIIAINPVEDDEAAILRQFRTQGLPIHPFWTIAGLFLRLCGIRASTTAMNEIEAGVPTLVLHCAAHERLPAGELSRIREWISVHGTRRLQ